MKKFLFEETGEMRQPKVDEYYLGNIKGTENVILLSSGMQFGPRPILRVTEITDKLPPLEEEGW
jgi:hypothetical protein